MIGVEVDGLRSELQMGRRDMGGAVEHPLRRVKPIKMKSFAFIESMGFGK